MCLFYDWEDNGVPDVDVQRFISLYEVHPVAFPGSAYVFWTWVVSARSEWKLQFPELFERFSSTDIERIPWRLKIGYSYVVRDKGCIPVPDYGVPLLATSREIHEPNGEVYLLHIAEGETYKEAMERHERRKSISVSWTSALSVVKIQSNQIAPIVLK